MQTSVNLAAIFIANLFGFLLLLMLLLNSSKSKKGSRNDNFYLRLIILISMLGCLSDPFAFAADGMPGSFARFSVYFGNFIFYECNILVSTVWVKLLAHHIYGKLSKLHEAILYGANILGFIFLIINCFVPIVFYVDENNSYHRMTPVLIYSAFIVLLFLDGFLIYIRAKKRGGILTFFPVFYYVIPFALGFVFQSAFYGLSTIWPSVSISIVGLFVGLQNELIYMDKLTGIYNRFYLDYLRAKAQRTKTAPFTVMMLDMNNFKSINDTYGHLEGDEALVNVAKVLTDSVASLGSVIRYAGDEFIIVLNTQNISLIEEVQNSIRENLDSYNTTSGKEYVLSLSLGYACVDLKIKGIGELLNEVDKSMYADKQKFYAVNDRRR